MHKKLRSPLRYPGGKQRQASKINDLFPENTKEIIEPFAGGASVSIEFIRRGGSSKINDLFTPLFVYWKHANNNNSKLVGLVKKIKLLSLDDLKKVISECKWKDTIKDASIFFSMNRSSFSGISLSGGLSPTAHKMRFTDSSIERLSYLGNIFSEVSNMDANDFIKSNLNKFIFLDPPYLSAEQSKLYGKKGSMHKGFNHEELFATLKLTKSKFLMTYDKNDFIMDMYKDNYIYE